MPEMFSPSQNLRHNSLLESSSILIIDGRYSGVTKGACIGHTSPEAYSDGKIGFLLDGDILHLNLENMNMNIIDINNNNIPIKNLINNPKRIAVQKQRKDNINKRRLDIATSNLLTYTTSPEYGVCT